MGKLDYLAALKRAMSGLPARAQAKTLAYYEQRFIDGLAAGMSEEEISSDLDDPKKIAMTLRSNTHLDAFAAKRNPANAARVLVSALGLAIFNLFMLVPGIVYAALLATMYACSVGFYLSGVVITGSGLSGANEAVIAGPLRHFVLDDDGEDAMDNMQTVFRFGTNGINVFQEKIPETAGSAAALATDVDIDSKSGSRSERALRRAEQVAEYGFRTYTDMDAGSRTTQAIFGIGLVLGGIVLFLLSLVVTRYTLIGIRRYIEMNISLLKGS
jgi:uncharacterized membrane protein